MALTLPSPKPRLPELPQVRSLNLDLIDLFYDVYLDDLSVLFFGRQRRHSLRAIGDNLYAPVDPGSWEPVGIEFHNFVKKFVPHDPSLGSAISMATILSDEISEGAGTDADNEPVQHPLERLYGQ